MSDMSMLINGLKVTAEKGATFERRNPLDGSVATRAPAASEGDAVAAVDAAAEAFKTWSQTTREERLAVLNRIPSLNWNQHTTPQPGLGGRWAPVSRERAWRCWLKTRETDFIPCQLYQFLADRFSRCRTGRGCRPCP